MAGPLTGIRIVELAGIGPAPFAAMMLVDHGAEVIRVDRPGATHFPHDPLLRSRTSIVLDLKKTEDVTTLRDLCRTADGLIEGFRPGVMERLGLGPDVLLADNPKLVYGRMTGWGQTGPWAAAAGHDINYIALSGVLSMVGRADERPLAPLNFAGDFGGGAMMLAFGMLAAILHARASGEGQVIDCAMAEGSALLASMVWGFRNDGSWLEQRGVNLLDSGAPYYDTYRTADGHHVALGALEPQFYALLRERGGFSDDALLDEQRDRSLWPAQKARMAEIIASRTRDEWSDLLAGTDACLTPVLSMTEAPAHPHAVARNSFVNVGGDIQPAPTPRYSKTMCDIPVPPSAPGVDTQAVLDELQR